MMDDEKNPNFELTDKDLNKELDIEYLLDDTMVAIDLLDKEKPELGMVFRMSVLEESCIKILRK